MYHIILALFLTCSLFFPIQLFAGLPLGTQIMTSNGPALIESLSVGSKISGYNAQDNSFPDITVENIKVEDVESLSVISTDKGIIHASKDQLFYELVSDSFIKAEELKAGDVFITKIGEKCLCINVEHKEISTKIYDITLQEPHLFFSSYLQVLTHNSPALVYTLPWLTQAIQGIIGFCVATVCLYNEQPTHVLSKLDTIEEKLKKDMTSFSLKHYCKPQPKSASLLPENYKNNCIASQKQPLKGGVKIDLTLFQEMTLFPLRFGPIYPIATISNTGDVACIIMAPRFSHRRPNGEATFVMTDLGKELFPRSHQFVKTFVQAEDKMQLDELRTSIKKWPQALINQCFKSKVTLETKNRLRVQHGCFDKTIYGTVFGIDALYNMAAKNIPPSLILQTMHHGNKALVRNPNCIICFEQKENVAVLIDIKSKKIINIASFNGGISSLDEEQAEEAEKAREAKEKSDKAVNEALQGTTPGEKTKGKSKQFEKPEEGLKEGLKDFEAMPLSDIQDIPTGKRGRLPDGRFVNIRSGSKDGRPTLEIYNGKHRIKIRYGVK